MKDHGDILQTKRASFDPCLVHICQTAGYRAKNFITLSSRHSHHTLQILAPLNAPELRSIFEGMALRPKTY